VITMPKGGARTRSGPPPDPNALARERDAGEWTVLPAAGRQVPAPQWPLTDADERELALWTELWAKPQAFMWARFHQEHEVALYVRRLVEAEKPESKVTVGTLVRQMGDSLGLSTPGMRANRWRIEAAADSSPSVKPPAARRSARERFKVVDGDGA
jgi:hypothetical protein